MMKRLCKPKRLYLLLNDETDPYYTLEKTEQYRSLHQAINKLTIQEQRVITLLYGFIGEGNLSRLEVSEALNISLQRVYQVEKLALRKLKLRMEIHC
ncbi:sigma-70 family RNA polymerase sigma factor [Alkalicoccus halolimnae]|uniref:sigma-70 family RNA polymerase sigma factor n=1 Tax=Alkalicoccus halolimnae TaxID=1667239 RepID=UPI0011CA5BE4|nr:sigma-70 family RNA polymerase sigma factor [Alkalicoccus halolimnae]